MITKQDALNLYNDQNNTKYNSVKELAVALVQFQLKQSVIQHRKHEAYLIAEKEDII